MILRSVLVLLLLSGCTRQPQLSPAESEPPADAQHDADLAKIDQLLERIVEPQSLRFDYTSAILKLELTFRQRCAQGDVVAARKWYLAELDRPVEEIVMEWQAGKYSEKPTTTFWTPP